MNTDILDKPIAFHRCFVSLTGSVNAALMLSQAMYWQKRNEDGVWWFQTQEKWADETGLSRREQETARKALRSLPFWKEELRGLPGKLHFFLDLELLLEIVTVSKTSLHKPAILHSTNQPYSDGGTSHTSSKEEESKEETYLSPPAVKTEKPSHESTSSKESLALALYKTYPVKEAKQAALKAILKAMKTQSFDYLLERVSKYAECTSAWPKDQLRYIPGPAVWFNQGRYDDDESRWVRNSTPTSSPIAQRIDLQKRIESIDEQIKEHPGNPEWIGYDQRTAKQQDKEALQLLRRQLAELRKQLNATP